MSQQIIKTEIQERLKSMGFRTSAKNVNLIYHLHLGDVFDIPLDTLIRINSNRLES